MARRPYIQVERIRDALLARAYGSRPDGYTTHCTNSEPIGMSRNDWFRWQCRDCNKTYISKRLEKRQRYYQCTECEAWHFVYKGFFTQPDRSGGSETVPLRQDEFNGELYKARILYEPLADVEDGDWYYGTKDWLQEKANSDNYRMVEQPKKV